MKATVAAFRASLEAEWAQPNVRASANIDYPWFIVRGGHKHLYDEAASVLEEFVDGPSSPSAMETDFPVVRYRYYTVKALLADHNRDRASARMFSRKAIEATTAKKSGFRYHQLLGLVRSPDQKLQRRLRRLAK